MECPLLFPNDSNLLTVGESHAILWTVLPAFLISAIAYGIFRRQKIQGFESTVANINVHWFWMALSYFSTLLGSWVLFITPLNAFYGGWFGLFSMAFAVAPPFLVLVMLASRIKRDNRGKYVSGQSSGIQGNRIYQLNDWVRMKYGRFYTIYVSAIAAFGHVIGICVELQALGFTFARAINGSNDHVSNENRHISTSIIAMVAMSIIVLLYTLAFGFRSSLFTDRVQGGIIIVTTAALLGVFFSMFSFGESGFGHVVTDKQANTGISQILTYFSGFFFDFSIWQRLFIDWSVGSRTSDLKAATLAGVFVTVVLFLLGLVGAIVRDATNCIEHKTFNNTFIIFYVALQHSKIIVVCWVILLVALIASTLDSMINAILSLLTKRLIDIPPDEDTNKASLSSGFKNGLKKRCTLQYITAMVIVTISVVIPMGIAIHLFLTDDKKVMNLFLLSNILQSTAIVPIIIGVYRPISKATAWLSSACSLLIIFLWGALEFNSIAAGFEMFGLMIFTTNSLRCRRNARWFDRDLINSVFLTSDKSIPAPQFYDDISYDLFITENFPVCDIDIPYAGEQDRTPLLFASIFLVSSVVCLLSLGGSGRKGTHFTTPTAISG